MRLAILSVYVCENVYGDRARDYQRSALCAALGAKLGPLVSPTLHVRGDARMLATTLIRSSAACGRGLGLTPRQTLVGLCAAFPQSRLALGALTVLWPRKGVRTPRVPRGSSGSPGSLGSPGPRKVTRLPGFPEVPRFPKFPRVARVPLVPRPRKGVQKPRVPRGSSGSPSVQTPRVARGSLGSLDSPGSPMFLGFPPGSPGERCPEPPDSPRL